MSVNSRILILSLDYELFFQDSGSIERCLFEPCDALLAFADSYNIRFTFFVDAGMFVAMERHGNKDARLREMLSKVQKHVTSLAKKGHEIALHVHPHWEDTRWSEGRWQFQGTRYQLNDFKSDEVSRIVRRYSDCLADLSGETPTSYRAGGFCVEPFTAIGQALIDVGIRVDSSVVPGSVLQDREKGFDFRSAPDKAWWEFDEKPSVPKAGGRFLEIPITPQKLPHLFYWGRLLERLGATRTGEQFGDGKSKAIGKTEILRRLVATSRVAELSIDDAKAAHLLERRIAQSQRQIWHLMGHPKLVSARSIETVRKFIQEMRICQFETVGSVANRLRNRESSPSALDDDLD